MFMRFLFRQFSLSRQVSFIKKHAVIVGVRKKKDRHAYLYMFRNLFAEILYRNDDPGDKPESIKIFDGLKKLNYHLEKEIKTVV